MKAMQNNTIIINNWKSSFEAFTFVYFKPIVMNNLDCMLITIIIIISKFCYNTLLLKNITCKFILIIIFWNGTDHFYVPENKCSYFGVHFLA